MTASQQAKTAGLKNLKEVSEMTGVNANTLGDWSKYKPKLFEIVLTGCMTTKTNEEK